MASDDSIDSRAIKLSKKYGGKLTLSPTFKPRSQADLSLIYTPGVAAVSEEIRKDESKSYDLTWRWNTIFIVTNGTRVLGMGDIGPLASLPVMEGKAVIYKTFGGVNAVPIPIKTKDPDEFVKVVSEVASTAGGIHLEDIESPFCFEILERLRAVLKVPVWHDDQQGTAAATIAGLINAFKLSNKELKKSKIVLIGAGAANLSLFSLLVDYGVDVRNVVLVDSKGVLYKDRGDVDTLRSVNKWKYEATLRSNSENITSIERAFEGADAVVGFSVPGSITPELIHRMNDRPIVFANANPTPEIFPKQAIEAGAYVVSTGRSDFPNQINNSLIFPGLFRGILDSRASKIDNGTGIAAAETLAKFAERKGLRQDYIIPRMTELDIYPRVAAAVAHYSSIKGYSPMKESEEYFYRLAKKRIAKLSK